MSNFRETLLNSIPANFRAEAEEILDTEEIRSSIGLFALASSVGVGRLTNENVTEMSDSELILAIIAVDQYAEFH